MRVNRASLVLVLLALAACDCGDGTIDSRPRLVVVPERIEFGAVAVGASVSHYVELTNEGRGRLYVTAVEVADDEAGAFSVADVLVRGCDGRVRPEPVDSIGGAECARVVVRFGPVARTAFAAKLVVSSDDPETPELEIELVGRGAGPVVKACALEDGSTDGAVVEASCSDPQAPEQRASVAFGTVAVGTTKQRVLRLSNEGDAPLRFDLPVLQPADAPFAIAGTIPREIPVGESVDVALAYAPSEEADHAAVLLLRSNDEQRQALEVALSGSASVPVLVVCVLTDEGEEDPSNCTDLSVEPPVVPGIDFGTVPAFEVRARTIRFKNAGSGALVVSSTTLQTPSAVLAVEPAFVGTINPGESGDVTVSFAPLDEARSDNVILIATNDVRQPLAEVPIRAQSEGPRICVTPSPVDFGNVATGYPRVVNVEVSNCGLVPWTLTSQTIVEANPATPVFSLVSPPVSPVALAPGAATTLQVRYAPPVEKGDSGTLKLIADRVSADVPLTGRGAPPSCESLKPMANAGVDRDSRPLSTVTLDGRGSTSPRGGAVSYQWRIASQPANANARLSSTTTAQPSFSLPLAGEYVVELVVRDSSGCQSDPDTVRVRAMPDARFHVQLTWPQSYGDVDLHVVGPGGTFNQAPGDVFWNNKRPDWGRNNTVQPDGNPANDVRLDLDDLWGNGPENVNQDQLFDGDFQVKLNYFCSAELVLFFCSSSRGSVTPTVKIFVDGIERHSRTATLAKRQMLDVATIRVSANGTRVDVVATGGAPRAAPSSAYCLCD